tara:strand:+ start:1856 stop:2227 length:372 start_codon:yes stop_codon:yes gene_type:complete
MSFVLKKKNSYTWPITLILPIDGGRREKETFDGEFKRLPQSRINEIVKQARAMEARYREDDEILEDQSVAKEVLIGWSGVVDDDGKDIKFGESTLNQLLEIPTIASQIVKAWFESNELAKKKN